MDEMSRSFTTSQSLGLLRDISSDYSDGERSDNDMNDVETEGVQAVLLKEESSDSPNDHESDSGVAVSSNRKHRKMRRSFTIKMLAGFMLAGFSTKTSC